MAIIWIAAVFVVVQLATAVAGQGVAALGQKSLFFGPPNRGDRASRVGAGVVNNDKAGYINELVANMTVEDLGREPF